MTELIRNRVVSLIRYFRGQKVILDSDIAQLYGVETKRLKEAVRRNIERFPHDFMFKLSREEYASLRSQIASLKRGQHSKYLPFVQYEQMEKKYDKQFQIVFEAIKELMREDEKPKKKIGF